MTLIQKELKWNFENEKNEWKVNTLFSHKVLQYSSSSSSTHVLLTGRRLQHICNNATMLTLYIYCIRRERHIEKYMTYSQKYWLYFIYESVNCNQYNIDCTSYISKNQINYQTMSIVHSAHSGHNSFEMRWAVRWWST